MIKDDSAKVAKSSGGRFTNGTPKPANSGRKKGTPNKKTKELMEILGSFNPAEKLMEIYNTTKDVELKASICKDLMKYVYPQRKAVEIANDVELPPIKIEGIKV